MPVCYGWFTLVLSPPNQQTTTLPKTAQESGGSSPTTSAFLHCSNLPFPRVLYSSLAWHRHYAITRTQTEQLESIKKRAAIHIIYPFTWDISYSDILFLAQPTYLESRRNQLQGHSFKVSLSHSLPSIIYFPLYMIRLSCLSSEQPHGSQALCHIPKILFLY